MIRLVEGPFGTAYNAVRDPIAKAYNNRQKKKEDQGKLNPDNLYKGNDYGMANEANPDLDWIIKFYRENDKNPNPNDNLKTYLYINPDDTPSIIATLKINNVPYKDKDKLIGEEGAKPDTAQGSGGTGELARKILDGGYYSKYKVKNSLSNDVITLKFDDLKEDKMKDIIWKYKGIQDPEKKVKYQKVDKDKENQDSQNKELTNPFKNKGTGKKTSSQRRADKMRSRSKKGNESMDLKEKKFSFKDNHICDGCGKPLSQCTCKVDGLEEDYDEDEWDVRLSDFSDGSVEEGDTFVEGGVEYTWVKPYSDPFYDDFDRWRVWSAESEDGEEVYFVVEEDTGFIDWGPCDTFNEAYEFMMSKSEDEEDLEECTTTGHPSDEYDLDYVDPELDYHRRITRKEIDKKNKELKNTEDEIEFGLDEDLDLSDSESNGDTLLISINGTPYEYKLNSDSPFTVEEMTYKVNRMKGFSAGKALQFLKKNMTGTKVQTESVDLDEERTLSDKKGTIANILMRHRSELDATKNREELINKVAEYFEEENLDTPKTREVMMKMKQTKNYFKALEYVYNLILKGDGLGTVGGSAQLSSLDQIDETQEVVTEDISSGATQPSDVGSAKVDSIDLMPDSTEEEEEKDLEECLIRVEVTKDDVTTTYTSTNLDSVKNTMKLAGVTEDDVTEVEGCEKKDLFDQEVQ